MNFRQMRCAIIPPDTPFLTSLTDSILNNAPIGHIITPSSKSENVFVQVCFISSLCFYRKSIKNKSIYFCYTWQNGVLKDCLAVCPFLLYHPSLFLSPISLVNSQTMSNQRTLWNSSGSTSSLTRHAVSGKNSSRWRRARNMALKVCYTRVPSIKLQLNIN